MFLDQIVAQTLQDLEQRKRDMLIAAIQMLRGRRSPHRATYARLCAPREVHGAMIDERYHRYI